MSYLHVCLSLFIESYVAENQDFVYSIYLERYASHTYDVPGGESSEAFLFWAAASDGVPYP